MVGIKRKIWKIGDSIGMTFAPEIREALNLKHGDIIIQDIVRGEVRIKKQKDEVQT